MNKYIKDITTIIRDCSMENTYKMSWIRSIVEYCSKNPNINKIKFEHLSLLIFKYYWNQTIFFNLVQGSNPNKPPEIYQLVKNKIQEYQFENNHQPIFFNRIRNKINIDIDKINRILKKDVSWRFTDLGKKKYEIYNLNINDLSIEIPYPDKIKEHSDILFELINYRWTQQLEKFNSSPRISKKVNCTDREDIKRGGLSKFKKYLDLENPDHICFISGEKIDKDLSIDHVIPWSYLFSDDIWNLVYVKKSENSSKSNKIPSEKTILKLEKRNKRLLEKMNNTGLKDKRFIELKQSIEKDYVKEFWYGCKG